LEVGNVNGALSTTPGYLVALMRELLHVRIFRSYVLKRLKFLVMINSTIAPYIFCGGSEAFWLAAQRLTKVDHVNRRDSSHNSVIVKHLFAGTRISYCVCVCVVKQEFRRQLFQYKQIHCHTTSRPA